MRIERFAVWLAFNAFLFFVPLFLAAQLLERDMARSFANNPRLSTNADSPSVALGGLAFGLAIGLFLLNMTLFVLWWIWKRWPRAAH